VISTALWRRLNKPYSMFLPHQVRRVGCTLAVGVLNIDVEGHERAVLEGAERALAGRRIRDILFEDFDEPPTAVTQLLQGHGTRSSASTTRCSGPGVDGARPVACPV
jgi:hypothetical protein